MIILHHVLDAICRRVHAAIVAGATIAAARPSALAVGACGNPRRSIMRCGTILTIILPVLAVLRITDGLALVLPRRRRARTQRAAAVASRLCIAVGRVLVCAA